MQAKNHTFTKHFVMDKDNICEFWKCPFCENIYHFFNEKDIDEHNSKCKEKHELLREIKIQESKLETITNRSLVDHIHINKNQIELEHLSIRKLKNSVTERETQLQALHRRSWIRAESKGAIRQKSQQCKGCSHSHSQVLSEHNYADFSHKTFKKLKNGGLKQQNG